MNFDINFTKLIPEYLPSFLRTPVRVKWLLGLSKHIRTLHADFISVFTGLKSEMKWDGRSVLMERYLQIRFGLPGIAIVNNNLSINPLFGYPCPNPVNPIGYAANSPDSPIGGVADANTTSHGFTVQIPEGSNYDVNEMTAVVNRYLIGSSSFEIVEV